MRFARSGQLGVVGSEQNEFGIHRPDRQRNGVGEFRVAHRHVVKRAVRFHVIRSHARGDCQRAERANLVNELRNQIRDRNGDLLAPEVFPIRKTRMRADCDAVVLRRADCGDNGHWVAGVKTRCDVGRTDQLKQLGVVPRALAKVRVQING